MEAEVNEAPNAPLSPSVSDGAPQVTMYMIRVGRSCGETELCGHSSSSAAAALRWGGWEQGWA